MGSDNKSLLEQLEKLRGSKTVILGIGNTLKGDDGAGPLVCEGLSGKVCAEVMDVGTVPENYIQPIIKKRPQNLVIIDAIDFGGLVGEIKVFKPEQLNSLIISTHTLSPRIFIDMIGQEIDINVYFVGIQSAQVRFGEGVSVEVESATQRLVSILVEVFPLGA
ncbi:MAG: hydrogenase 3 maturation endopeptidase HyCI [Planctomycetes bacterium]|nr:hydrogenase 3 maturation endopeptidase HyCI [Planctomycetota bacterium]